MEFPEDADKRAPRRPFTLWGIFYFHLKKQMGDKKMKKMIFLGWLMVFIPVMLFAQEKIDAPVWNVGDKWTFMKHPTVVVVNADGNDYTVKHLTRSGENIYILDKSSLNTLYSMEGNKRVPYKGVGKRALNFPLNIGKTWKDNFITSVLRGGIRQEQQYSFIETRTVLGWEDIEVRAGKFKALKIEVKQERIEEKQNWPKGGMAWMWYAPDVRFLIKRQFDSSKFWVGNEDWELTSFELKK